MDIYKVYRIRPYKNFNLCKLLRTKSFYYACSFPKVINNLKNLYDFSSRCIGERATNLAIKNFCCDIFTGGSNLKELEESLPEMHKMGVTLSLQFCQEFLTHQEEHKSENIINVYLRKIEMAIKYNPKNAISLKVSSIADFEILKKLNDVQNQLDELNIFFENVYNNNKSSIEISAQFRNFLDKRKTDIGLNIFELVLNSKDEEIQLLCENLHCNRSDLDYVKTIDNRLRRIISYAESKQCSILYDAEQSYIQKTIDASFLYYARIYNRNFPTLLNTIQCYLKDSPVKIDQMLSFFRNKNIKGGLKVVRGAYLLEETRLSKEKGYSRLNWDTIEDTHSNYNSIMKKLLDEYREGDKIIFGSHNEESILNLVSLIEGKGEKFPEVYAAQLTGICDHITIYSAMKVLEF